MHTLVPFIGCIGQIMKGTGLEVLLKSNSKAWPKAMLGLRMVVLALIKNAINFQREPLHMKLRYI